MLAKCKEIKVLDLSGNSALTDTTLSAMSKGRKLVYLILVVNANHEPLGPENLKELKLNSLELITDNALLKLLILNKGLEKLELCKCSLIEDNILTGVTNTLICLRIIDINWCPLITQEAIDKANRTRPALRIIR